MKTLAEVIKANECCDHGEPDSRCEDCPYNGIGACCAERESDALHYLKEYQEMLNTRIYIPEGYTREKTGFTHQDFANTFGEEPHFIRDFMVGTSQKLRNTSQITCPKCHSEFVILPEANNALTMEYFSKQIDTEPIWCEKLGEWYLFLAYDDGENEIQLMSDKGDIETFDEEDLEKYPLYRRK